MCVKKPSAFLLCYTYFFREIKSMKPASFNYCANNSKHMDHSYSAIEVRTHPCRSLYYPGTINALLPFSTYLVELTIVP
ncbi:hypothetical protein EUGRSUZ_K01527 [Eucalyptus grandis]|uniref:Uncharacterized protein n=2 Tax=Eucalyptus grandis TaxID=71139 RepID=A0ACC3IV29_EUCGR|nr:hypothetical protein EUGRSUZ_K01527 [Eucalyptus grandis]